MVVAYTEFLDISETEYLHRGDLGQFVVIFGPVKVNVVDLHALCGIHNYSATAESAFYLREHPTGAIVVIDVVLLLVACAPVNKNSATIYG